MSKVTIYTTPTCKYCTKAKEYMKENEIKYKEYDVAEDAGRRQEMVEMSGQMGVPVLVVDDHMMVGFEEGKFQELLETAAKEEEGDK